MGSMMLMGINQDQAAAAASNDLLLEDSSYVLLEDGSKIILES